MSSRGNGSSHSAAREQMFAEVTQGSKTVLDSISMGDASSKTILGRGCDPIMAKRRGVKIISVTEDDLFIQKLKERKYDVIFFAPGACRWDAAKKPIPGSVKETTGWNLTKYRELVRDLQGSDVVIVETTEEREIVPLLRKALKLPV